MLKVKIIIISVAIGPNDQRKKGILKIDQNEGTNEAIAIC